MEIQLFVLWPRALSRANQILHDIRDQFLVRDVLRVEWSRAHFARNLTRFYGQVLPRGSHKERHCGVGPFLVIVVEDREPTYETRRVTSGALESANAKMVDSKQRYRDWTGGGHRVHGTLHPSEADHDLFLLLGRRAAYYEATSGSEWGGSIEHWPRELLGATGWRSIDELLEAIDVTMEYVVLDGLDGTTTSPDGSETLALLAEDRWWAASIANARSLDRWRESGCHAVRIAGRTVPLELREIGDGYFDAEWQRAVLRNRVRHPSGPFVPASIDQLYLALYRGLVHHAELPVGLAESLVERARHASLPAADFSNPVAAKAVLDNFLATRGYRYVYPRDRAVAFNAEVAGPVEKPRRIPRFVSQARTLRHVAGSMIVIGPKLRRPVTLVSTTVMNVITRLLAELILQELRWSRRRVGLVLLYHRVGDPPGDRTKELVPSLGSRTFEAQLRHLKRRYRVVPTSQVYAATAERRRGQAIPAAITFDDDLRSHLQVAAPVLRRLRLPATFFLCGASLDAPYRFWWQDLQLAFDRHLELGALEQLFPGEVLATRSGAPRTIHRVAKLVEELEPERRELVATSLRISVRDESVADSPLRAADVKALAADFEIGFHTLRHDMLTTLDDVELERALEEGRDRLEALVGKKLTLISYPHGKADRRVADAALGAGYSFAFTGMQMPVRAGGDRFLLGRHEPRDASSGAFALWIARLLGR